GAGGALFVHRD
nr:RecName: Full=NADH dehydrogenase [ubiquinone] flavoprotein 2; AltName: Full=NADH-ubiquinone oxidoreductase 24 kDa subunit [Canis lupus familiaris]